MGDLVSAATILAGSGTVTWVADKILGPSFEGVGEQFRAFAGDRMRAIFLMAADKIKDKKIKPIPPGAAIQIIQKASFSDDVTNITEMWANLLVSAGESFSSRHALFSDILSQMSGDDAWALNEIVPIDYKLTYPALIPTNIRSSIRHITSADLGVPPSSAESAIEIIRKISTRSGGWPAIVTNVSMPYQADGMLKWASGGAGMKVSHEVLMRQQLIERFDVTSPNLVPSPQVEMLIATGLGLEFLYVCRGL